MTTKEKIDQVLGITSGSSIDSFLSDLDIETNDVKQTFSDIDETIKTDLDIVDKKLELIKQDGSPADLLVMKDISTSMSEVESLIVQSKQIYQHITESILGTDLVDAELINAAAKLLESIHINISEFISLYRDKQKFVDKIKYAIFQQEQKKELIMLKHKLDMEKLQCSAKQGEPGQVIEAEGGMVPYSTADISKLLKQLETPS